MTQRILIAGPERRRHWSDEAKLSILVEAFAPGASPIEVARRHGISSGLLYTWRKKAMALANQSAPADSPPVFLPAVLEDAESSSPASSQHVAPLPIATPAQVPAQSPAIEVHFRGGVKVRIEAGMPEAVIAATLKALR